MNPFEFVLAIIVITGIFSLLRHRMGIQRRGWRNDDGQAVDSGETARLRDEVKTLQERIKVLERITVEKENSLSREIESLRDR
jgi:hypothetical protein